tara:strand:+ start:418 stop:534 length:117 start_codon:yes stop_codon:yes gene_type:complete
MTVYEVALRIAYALIYAVLALLVVSMAVDILAIFGVLP